jgi:hypothetical protein
MEKRTKTTLLAVGLALVYFSIVWMILVRGAAIP